MPQKIPMTDLPRLMTPYIGEVQAAIDRVLRSGQYVGGAEVAAFEREWAAFSGTRHAIGSGNGTDALAVALRALGIGPGDRVATVSLTAGATVAAVEMACAVPVWVEVEADTLTMSPQSLERVLHAHARTAHPVKAVIPVHLYGRPADMPEILRLADRYRCQVVEDCAQAHGASIGGHPCGSFGHFSAFSFYPTKNLGCVGDGGALCTQDDRLAYQARLVAQYGWEERNHSLLPGVNTRLDPVQAAILRVRLRHLAHENDRRRDIAARYVRALPPTLPAQRPGTADIRHVYHQFVIRPPDRDALVQRLALAGIESQVHYPVPVHRQAAYHGRCREGEPDLGLTETICRQVLSVPVHPALDDHEVGQVLLALTPDNVDHAG
jgi:dTDP-4-amino-4,6-dideoxygalactose transaminase